MAFMSQRNLFAVLPIIVENTEVERDSASRAHDLPR